MALVKMFLSLKKIYTTIIINGAKVQKFLNANPHFLGYPVVWYLDNDKLG